MKKQLKKIFLSCMLMTGLQVHIIASDDMPIPSVADVFAGMSEEEITQQVQEAQKLFESLSPEEIAEFEKVIEQTLANMSDQDLEDIQGIAKMVEPHLDLPKDEIEEKKEEPKKEEKTTKSKKTDVDTNDIQVLIDNINQQIDDVLQKANSSKELAEEFSSKWSSKVTFDSLKRNILALKQDRLAKKLKAKENQEDKDLVEKLELFYKSIKEKNNNFDVEDNFGMPSENKNQNKAQLKQAKDIKALFEDTIDDTMPTLDKFLRKYDPEAIEMAKEAEERAKKSKAHATDSTVRRGSAPAIQSQDNFGPARQTQGSPPLQGRQNYSGYDPYTGYPLSGYDYPGSSPFGNKSEGKKSDNPTSDRSGDSKNNAKSESPKAKEIKKEDTDAYDNAIEELESHLSHFSNKKESDNLDFLQNQLAAYPVASNSSSKNFNKLPITHDTQQQDWINSSGTFVGGGFKLYSDTMNQSLTNLHQELKEFLSALSEVEYNISKMSVPQLKKLASNKEISAINNRMQKYKDAYSNSMNTIDKQFLENMDPASGAILSSNLATNYKSAHTSLTSNLNDKGLSKITEVEGKIDKVKSRIQAKLKRQQRKSKSSQAVNAV